MKRFFTITFMLSLLMITLTSCGNKKVDLTETYTIIYQGNDGEGKAIISLNGGALESQLNLNPQNDKELRQLMDFGTFESTINYTTEPKENLSNGQEIKILCTWNQESAKIAKVSPVFKETTIKIPDDAFRVIHQLTKDEIFENAAIQTEGIYPNLNSRVQYTKTNDITSQIRLSIESIDYPNKKAVVKAEMSPYDADNLGVSMETTTKEFELENYSKYIDDIAELDKQNRSKIMEQAKNNVFAYLEKQRTSNSFFNDLFPYAQNDEQSAMKKFDDIKLDKVYFLTLKEGMQPNGSWSAGSIYNQSILLYSTTIYHHKKPEGTTFYFPVFLNNIVLLSNNELDYKLANISLKESDIKSSNSDYKSIYINQYIDKYNGIEISGEEFSK